MALRALVGGLRSATRQNAVSTTGLPSLTQLRGFASGEEQVRALAPAARNLFFLPLPAILDLRVVQ